MSIRNSSTPLSALLICLTAHAYGQNVLPSAGAQSMSAASSCGAASATDSSALARVATARKQIDAQYAKLADAISRKDLDAIIALYTPDFHAVTATGEVWTRERSLNYVRAGMSQVTQTRHIINTIVAFTACGDTATATVLQYWDRTQMKAGKLRHVDTHAVQDEQWVRMSEGWRRGNIFNVRNGPAFVDGKRVDTNKQYDPEAPAYDPYDPRPKQPAADTLLRIATEHGIGAALDAARILRHSDRYFVTESQLNTLGYGLLASKRTGDAIEVFKLNASSYPRSGNAYDSLGEAYLAHGDTLSALRSYRRALQLDPANANAKEIVAMLGSRSLRRPGATIKK